MFSRVNPPDPPQLVPAPTNPTTAPVAPANPALKAEDKQSAAMRRVMLDRGIVPPDSPKSDPLIKGFFTLYVDELQRIAAINTVSQKVGALLSEEEIVIGCILSLSPQPGRKKAQQERMRSQTTELVRQVLVALRGPKPAASTAAAASVEPATASVTVVAEGNEEEGVTQDIYEDEDDVEHTKEWVLRAWKAWQFSRSRKDYGSMSFALLATAGFMMAIEALPKSNKRKV